MATGPRPEQLKQEIVEARQDLDESLEKLGAALRPPWLLRRRSQPGSAGDTTVEDTRDWIGPGRFAERAIATIEHAGWLGELAEPVAAWIARWIPPGPRRDVLSGSWLGHPLHPPLTDLPIGCWAAASVLDLIGARSSGPLVAIGILGAVPAAITGASDWSADRRVRQVGLVHALANSGALAFETGSLMARLRGHRMWGRALGAMGLSFAIGGSWLGGHLAYRRGVGVSRTAFATLELEDWIAVADRDALADGTLVGVDAGQVPLLLQRNGSGVLALSDQCTYDGTPLHHGVLVDGGPADSAVRCRQDGSSFRLRDGAVLRGPASSPATSYEVRILSDKVEVRSRPVSV